MWNAPTEQEKLAERIHYEIMRNIVPNNSFNAIKYLYDRLNIIDAKAQGLLTRNGLLLTTVSIVASTQIGKSWPFLYDENAQIVFGIAFILLFISTILTIWIMFIRFDSITVVPELAKIQLQAACTCNAPRPHTCPAINDCAFKELGARIAELAAAEQNIPPDEQKSNRPIRAYEDLFFAITIKRQKSLRVAQYCTVAATIMFFGLIGFIFWKASLPLPPPGLPVGVL